MARGHPDYFGMSVFPKFGPFNREYVVKAITSIGYTTLIDIEGKGQIYGGVSHVSSGVAILNDYYYILIDGVDAGAYPFSYLYDHGYFSQPFLPVSLLRYDKVSHDMDVLFGARFTFEQTFQIKYYANSAINRNTTTRIFWSQVE